MKSTHMEWFPNFDHVLQAFLATLCTWGVTALSAAMAFYFKSIDRRVLDGMLGFAGHRSVTTVTDVASSL
jgi:ZIP family zinc transporter